MMDQHSGDCQNSSLSSTEPTANNSLVGVCDDCCIDGSLLPTDDEVPTSFLTLRGGADNGDHRTQDLDDRCEARNFTDTDAADGLQDRSGMDNMQHDGDGVDDGISSVHVRSSNDGGDVTTAEKVTREAGEKCEVTGEGDEKCGAAVDEPVISATDVFGGLCLSDGWNPVTAQRHREVGVGRRAPSQFTCQASASLALVRRLQLYSKLDGHTGCVNALHFNDAGNGSCFLPSLITVSFLCLHQQYYCCTYSPAVTTLSDSAVLTLIIVVLVVASLLRPL